MTGASRQITGSSPHAVRQFKENRQDGQTHTTVNRLIIIEKAINRAGNAGDSEKEKKRC